MVISHLDGFGRKIGFCKSAYKPRYNAVLAIQFVNLLIFEKKFFLTSLKIFLFFFPKFQEMLRNPVVSRDYKIQFFVQFCPISEKFRKFNQFSIKMIVIMDSTQNLQIHNLIDRY